MKSYYFFFYIFLNLAITTDFSTDKFYLITFFYGYFSDNLVKLIFIATTLLTKQMIKESNFNNQVLKN